MTLMDYLKERRREAQKRALEIKVNVRWRRVQEHMLRPSEEGYKQMMADIMAYERARRRLVERRWK